MIFELQYWAVAEFNELLFSFCLQTTSLCQLCDGSQAGSRVLKAMWSGKLSDNYTAIVYIATLEQEILDVIVKLNQAMGCRYSRTSLGIALSLVRPG